VQELSGVSALTVKLMSNCGGFMAKVLNSRTVLVFHMATSTIVQVPQDLLDAIFEGAKRLYPKETFMLLRGKKSKDTIRVSDLVVPPLAVYGYGFANLPFHMLPMDFSVVGTVHSHPSGNINPSSVDLNHFFGRVLMIVGFPFASAQNVAVYDSKGERLPFQVTEE
jgi:proteasome lid subunit RPN8/RPN11